VKVAFCPADLEALPQVGRPGHTGARGSSVPIVAYPNIAYQWPVAGSCRESGMTKSELIQRIAELNPHLYHRDVARIVNTIFEEISAALERGDRVELRGFGAFSTKQRDARAGRNPRTGDTVQVEAKAVPYFKTGKQLRERLNGG